MTSKLLSIALVFLSTTLVGFRSQMGFWTNRDPNAGCPGGSIFSASFVDSTNNRGQGWRYSNIVTVSGLTSPQTLVVRKVPGGANVGVRVNGSHTSVSYNGSEWLAEVTVNNGDTVQLAGVTNVAGGTGISVRAEVCGNQEDWNASTKDYGPNNCTGLTNPRVCTGSIIQSFIGGASDYHLINGCIDWAQEYGTGARCVERIGADCFVYDGARTSASGWAADCGT